MDAYRFVTDFNISQIEPVLAQLFTTVSSKRICSFNSACLPTQNSCILVHAHPQLMHTCNKPCTDANIHVQLQKHMHSTNIRAQLQVLMHSCKCLSTET